MKINKTTIIVCTVLCILSGWATVRLGQLSYQSANYSTLYGIVSSIFTGLIVSIVVALIGYYHERNTIISHVNKNIKELYINMNVALNIIQNIVPKINFTEDLTTLEFKILSGMLELNSDFFKDMQIESYNPFFRKGKLNAVCTNLTEIEPILYNIKNSSSQILAQVQNHTILRLQLLNKRMRGEWVSATDERNLNIIQNHISILTAQLQVHIELKTLELEKIGSCFYAFMGKKYSWEKIKLDLLKQAEYVINRR